MYCSQPEPAFAYVSDACIPPVARIGMVRTKLDKEDDEGGESGYRIFDEATLQSILVTTATRMNELQKKRVTSIEEKRFSRTVVLGREKKTKEYTGLKS